MDNISIGVTPIIENVTLNSEVNNQIIDLTLFETVEVVNLDITPNLIEINILRAEAGGTILQFDTLANFPVTGSDDYFYLAKDTNKLYRWTGSAYVEISSTSTTIWGQITGTLSNQTDLQNALNLKAPIDSPTFTGTVSGITKAMVGLGSVDNTSDLDKPISTATQTALNAKQPLDGDLTAIAGLTGTAGFLKKNGANSYILDNSTYLSSITSSDVTTALGFTPENAANKGANNGYASLDGSGKVPSTQLPSYVDDVIEVNNFAALPVTGESGKIYITLDTNKIYRWTGSVYVEVSPSVGTVWGGITGTLSNQTDLQNALNSYYPASNPNGYTSNVGTVTSVALTVPSAFSVSGSPITSSGTLAVTATGDTTQYIAGDGSLVTFPTIGVAGTLIREVRNTTGATLTKGTVVYISGATGNKPTVSKALATGDSTSAQTFGLVQADIANNANGNVVCAGDITGINTSTFTEGAQLYLSSTTAGTYTSTKQYAPNHLVYIGVVTRAHPTLGQIEVNIQNGYELEELHNVAAQTPSNNDGLFYESSTSLWKNKSIATVLGYTPANGADYMALSGNQSISGQKTFTGFAYFDNTLFLKQTESISYISGYNSIAADTSGISIGITSGKSARFNLTSLTTNRDFTLPDSNGTLALLSDIPSTSSFVTTTGNQSIAGVKTFTSTVNANILQFSETGGFTYVPGYSQIGGSADNFVFHNGANTKTATFIYNSGGGTNYTLPSDSGTLALTSQLHNAVTIGTANGLSLSTQVLSLGLASTSTTGALSSTDWNTFNGKQNALTNPVTGTGTTSYLPKFTGTSAIGNSLLYDTGSVLLVGATSTSDSQSKLELVSANVVGLKIISTGANGNNTFLSIQSSKEWRFLTNRGDISGNQGDLIIRNNTDGINHIILNQAGATTFVGNVTATQRFEVKGANQNSVFFNQNAGGVSTGFVIGRSFGSTDAQDFFIFDVAANVARMFITSAGNIGIGTTSPNLVATNRTTVDINGANQSLLSFSNAGTFKGYIYNGGTDMDYSAVNQALFGAGTNVIINTAGSERMRVTSGGDVLIGTTTALYTVSGRGLLEINGSSSSLFALKIGNSVGSYLFSNASSTELYSTNPLIFSVNGAERVRITNGGQIQSSVSGANTVTSLFTNGAGDSNFKAGFANGSGSAINTEQAKIGLWYGTSGTPACHIGLLRDNSAGSLGMTFNFNNSERMRINWAGELMIGNTNAGFSSSNRANITLNASSSSIFVMQVNSANDAYLYTDGANTYLSRIPANGNIFVTANTGGVYLSYGATSWTANSDLRLKNVTGNIENAVESLMTLKPIKHTWKSDNSNKEHLALIAQEVEKVFPQLIDKSKLNRGINTSTDETEYLGVRYTELVPVLVKAIQELNQKIKTLENK